MSTMTPLEDPSYTPIHQPVNGSVPWPVERWGPYSQVRWFRRFHRKGLIEIAPMEYWLRFYCTSVQHRGPCCSSCVEDQNLGYDDWDPEWCCCRTVERGKDGEGRPLREGWH